MNATVNRLGLTALGLLLCVAWNAPLALRADESTLEPAPISASASAPNEFAQTIADCRQNAVQLRAEIATHQQSNKPAPRFTTAELELWERLELLTLQRKTVSEDDEQHRTNLGALAAEAAELEAPTSFLEVDDFRDRLESQRQQLRSLRLELLAERRIMLGVKEQFEEAEQARRRSEDRFDSSEPAARIGRGRERLLARLQSRVLAAELAFHREQAALMSVKIETHQAKVAGLEGVAAGYASSFRLTQEELDQRLAIINQMEAKVRHQLLEVNTRLRESMPDRAIESPTAATTAYDVAREESQLFQRLLSGAGEFKECWRRRFALSNGKIPPSSVERWIEESEQTQERVSQIVEQLKHRTQQRRESLARVNRAALSVQQNASRADLIAQAAELHRIIDVYGDIQILAAGGERLCQRLIEDLESRESQFSLSEYVQLAFGGLQSAWEFELTTIDEEPITVGKIVFGFVLLLCGYFLSRALASLLANRVFPKFGVTPAGAAVLRSVMFYLMVTAFSFASLEIANVPLTIFAFLGGAVAIGVGFGSQNLLNNFISGLILLVERPIRIGDLVNVEGIDANVEHIGARSTRVRTGANLEILVPNSKFLENNVTNWTLSDTRIRTSVSVGVAYGSPVREVSEILREVIRAHEKALANPEPIVLFQDFGDNSLAFEIHFWIHMKRMMDGARVRSDMRIAIDEAFERAGIVIAFPQRDVHIDMAAPIEVKMVDPSDVQFPRQQAA